ncbi:MAG: TerB family tellurite resistance protein [Rhizobiaceae bacterium]
MPGTLLAQLRVFFEGDPGVRRVADDPSLSAELLLLFRMMLADGEISQRELDTFKRICGEAFGIGEDSIRGVMRYLQDFGYETTAPQALDLFRALPVERRRQLVRHLARVAKADSELHEQEIKLLSRTIEFLGLEAKDAID